MFDFHKDKKRYFDMQHKVARDYIVPFIENHKTIDSATTVLEIGCAEAGVLKAFLEKEARCTGIELSPSRVELAKTFLKKEVDENQARFISENIYDIEPNTENHKYDIIVLKDVIEHIPDQQKLLHKLLDFLNPGGLIFFGFPPWQMPFGGHQQICSNRLLSKLPYYHLLPTFCYKGILKLAKEPDNKVKELLEIKETGISIERFVKISGKTNYQIVDKEHFLFNPIYQFKFNIKVRKQFPLVSAIPFLRNFVTTGVYYLVTPKS